MAKTLIDNRIQIFPRFSAPALFRICVFLLLFGGILYADDHNETERFWHLGGGYYKQYYYLDIRSKVADNIDPNFSADSGKYKFDPILIDHYDVWVQAGDFTYKYEHENADQDRLRNSDAETYKSALHLLGIGTIKRNENAFDHIDGAGQSRWNIIYHEAVFKGAHQYGQEKRTVKFDKTQLGVQYNTQNASYIKFVYENSKYPQVIHFNNTSFIELDEKFSAQKYTLVFGKDAVFHYGRTQFLLGGHLGFGYSALDTSSEMDDKIEAANIDSALGSGAFNFALGVKTGVAWDFALISDMHLSFGVITSWDYLTEEPFDEVKKTDSSGTERYLDTANYSRSENMIYAGGFVKMRF